MSLFEKTECVGKSSNHNVRVCYQESKARNQLKRIVEIAKKVCV